MRVSLVQGVALRAMHLMHRVRGSRVQVLRFPALVGALPRAGITGWISISCETLQGSIPSFRVEAELSTTRCSAG